MVQVWSRYVKNLSQRNLQTPLCGGGSGVVCRARQEAEAGDAHSPNPRRPAFEFQNEFRTRPVQYLGHAGTHLGRATGCDHIQSRVLGVKAAHTPQPRRPAINFKLNLGRNTYNILDTLVVI